MIVFALIGALAVFGAIWIDLLDFYRSIPEDFNHV